MCSSAAELRKRRLRADKREQQRESHQKAIEEAHARNHWSGYPAIM